LLSATPYNKTYLDLSNQLRLFVPEDKDLGLRPERLLREMGETEFIRRHQCSVRSLSAFEKSEYADDWRELMRLYMVRRTRSFIQENYAETDVNTGRKFITFENGERSYFPSRIPKTVRFPIDDHNPEDNYGRLYTPEVVETINSLCLPRYGLGNYVFTPLHEPPSSAEARSLQDLSRAGKRLMGFCRTNLFKRLESSGQAFIQSIERHILRNYVFLYAIENNQPLPIGTQDAGFLDSRIQDEDLDGTSLQAGLFDETDNNEETDFQEPICLCDEEEFKKRAEAVYAEYAIRYKERFKWLRSAFFVPDLADDLRADAQALLNILQNCGEWNPDQDAKLKSLIRLLTVDHPTDKIIIFTQFADTVRYLEAQLKKQGISRLSGVTGDSPDPTALAWRFSPISNNKQSHIQPEDELRILVATDVLSEGQNLQDCSIIVNYDLPWAIIRLVQRAGRVDRIGQQAEKIFCYSFLPADGVERIIKLRSRVRKRLQENAEVVGTDEAFFEDDRNDQAVVDLYHEKSGILEADDDTEVDLASYAYQIWKNAITADPGLQKIIPDLPAVVYSTKSLQDRENSSLSPFSKGEEGELVENQPEGVLVYLKTAEDNDALAWINKEGRSVTESQLTILKAAECKPDTPPLPRQEHHHELVRKGVERIIEEEKTIGGQLGRPSGARFRTYERLKRYAAEIKGTLFASEELLKAIDEIYRYPLRSTATDTLNRQLRTGISDEALAQLVIALRDEGRLCLIHEEDRKNEPRIICSMGLVEKP